MGTATLRELLDDLAASRRSGMGYVRMIGHELFIVTTDEHSARTLASRWRLTRRTTNRSGGYALTTWGGCVAGRLVDLWHYRPLPAPGPGLSGRGDQDAQLPGDRVAQALFLEPPTPTVGAR